MKRTTDTQEILVISSYPPRPCGIATYSQDIRSAITRRFGETFTLRICALEEGKQNRTYPPEVIRTLDCKDIRAYAQLAEEVNAEPEIKAIYVQHEFGLFGGTYGEDILTFLRLVHKPVIVTFHTVLKHPDVKRLEVVSEIAGAVDEITVMTELSRQILIEAYETPPEMISVIPHGTHLVRWKDKERMKSELGFEGKLILSTFGLLSSNKSIETALYALPAIRRVFPNVLYLILGSTHPGILAKEGETYRNSLHSIVTKLGLENNVRFVNRYLELGELLNFLRTTDVYLFTSKDRNQAVSGTLAYAMSCGCAVVSTRVPHAVELFENDTGILVDFDSPEQVSKATIRLLGDPDQRELMGHRAFVQTRLSAWDNVALSYAHVFARAIGIGEPTYSWPEISLAHLRRLTDQTGMIQFARISDPDQDSGYTLDDNARALIAACMYYELAGHESDISLLSTYLGFISDCQNADGSFFNYRDHAGRYSERNHYVNLEDSNGRTIWALGYLIASKRAIAGPLIGQATQIFKKAFEHLRTLSSPRAIAFTIKGLYYYYKVTKDEVARDMIRELADRMLAYYRNSRQSDWKWFEHYLTYANAVIPEGLLYAFLVVRKPIYKSVARISFDFLLKHMIRDGMLHVISNRGWMHRTSSPEDYGEQPIDVANTVMALDLFRRVFRNKPYRRLMQIAFEWFLGRNHLGQMIYNTVSGGCHDGLEESNINLNQGAESTVCYLIARMVMERLRREERHRTLYPAGPNKGVPADLLKQINFPPGLTAGRNSQPISKELSRDHLVQHQHSP